MSDKWDYRIRRMEMVWELTQRSLDAEFGGKSNTTAAQYLSKGKDTLEKASGIVHDVFTDDTLD